MNYSWIKDIPEFEKHFNSDHQLLIKIIGIDNYFKLYEYFGKTGVYFPVNNLSNSYCEEDKQTIIRLIGEEHYNSLSKAFSKSLIYFSSAPIVALKKCWAKTFKHIDHRTAARLLDTSLMTIYKWRSEDCGVVK